LKLVLKGRDGTGRGGKRGLQVSDGLRSGLARMKHGRRAALDQSAANRALAFHKTLPDSIGRRDAVIQICSAKGLSLVSQADYEFEESPQSLRAEPQAFEFIGGPYAEGMSAAVVALLAVIAEDTPAATRLSTLIVFGIAEQPAVKNQRFRCFAVRTKRQLQALTHAQEIILGMVKPRERKAQRNSPKAKSGDYTGL